MVIKKILKNIGKCEKQKYTFYISKFNSKFANKCNVKQKYECGPKNSRLKPEINCQYVMALHLKC